MSFRKPIPEFITPEDAKRARERLQRTTSFDIDRFFADHTVDVIFSTPLGSTQDCLTVDQIAEAAEDKLEGDAKPHLQHCDECLAQLHSYRRLVETDFTDATSEIDIASFIRVPAGE